MKENNIISLLPIISIAKDFRDGTLISLPDFCRQNMQSKKCMAFHKEVLNNGVLLQLRKCPFGYICSKTMLDHASAAYIGMCVKKLSPSRCFSDLGKLKAQYSENGMVGLINQNNTFIEKQIEVYNRTQYLPDLQHSLAKILDSAANNGYFVAEQMLRPQSERNFDQISNATITVAMASIQAKALFCAANIQAFGILREPNMPVSVWGKFVRASRTLRHLYKDARIDKFSGESDDLYQLPSSFGVIPYLILDNALKYSPNGGKVNVSFKESDEGLDVVIVNQGPHIPRECISKVWEKGYRTAGARKITSVGSGIGLHTIKSIVMSNQIDVSITSKEINNVSFNGTQMGEITFQLHVPVLLRTMKENEEEAF